MIKKYNVFFIDETAKRKYERLKYGNSSDRQLYAQMNMAIENIAQNPYYGIQVRERQIPKFYKKRKFDNIFKYDLPKGWRLIYTISRDSVEIFAVVIEWFDHKNYENRFHYLV